jgi:hypothetical protein
VGLVAAWPDWLRGLSPARYGVITAMRVPSRLVDLAGFEGSLCFCEQLVAPILGPLDGFLCHVPSAGDRTVY